MEALSIASIPNNTALSLKEHEEVLRGVKSVACAFDPNAQVVLFGSRARGDARWDSDYDFLILLHQPVDFQLKRKILDQLYSVELQTGCVIGALVENMEEWQKMEHSPIFSSIEHEGVAL